MLYRFIFLLTFLMMVGTSLAQDEQPPFVVAAHLDAERNVIVYWEAGDESLTLMPTESIPEGAIVRASLSPDTRYAAVLVEQVSTHILGYPAELEGKTVGETGLTNTLTLFRLPSGEKVFERQVLPDDFVFDFFFVPGAIYAPILDADIRDVRMLWSPEGRYGYWVEGTPHRGDENGYGRLVMFDTMDETITEFEPTEGVPFDVRWSLDGQYAVYRAISTFGTGAGYASPGAYLISPDGSTRALPLPVTERYSKDIIPLGWTPDNRFVFSMFSGLAGAEGLYVYDVVTDTLAERLPLGVELVGSAIDMHPASGQVVVTVSDFLPTDTITPGTYLYTSVDDEPQRLFDTIDGESADRATFLSQDVLLIGKYAVNAPYIGLYHIPTGEIVPEERGTFYTDATSHGIMFDLIGEERAILHPVWTGGEVYIIPREALDINYVQWVSDTVFLSYSRPYGSSDLLQHQLIISTTTGNYRVVPITDGRILDVQGDS